VNEQGMTWGSPIFIRIFKQEYELEVWMKKDKEYVLIFTYQICSLGNNEPGPKEYRGDGHTPEGFYFITPDRLNPYSNYYLSFDLGYPNSYDRAHQRTGSALMVHGGCASRGCVAMTDKNIEEIYTLADAMFRKGNLCIGIHIFPFRMTPENMEKHKTSQWINFWKNLKEGYDFFEKNGYPPDTLVENGRYVFLK